jgi:hypothetical protein
VDVLQVLPILLEGCLVKDPDCQQCAVFGLGVLAQKRPEVLRPMAPQALTCILGMITGPNARCGTDGQIDRRTAHGGCRPRVCDTLRNGTEL